MSGRAKGLSDILCARHTPSTRDIHAKQDTQTQCSAGVTHNHQETDQYVGGPDECRPMAFKKAFIEPALGTELNHHLGYAVHVESGQFQL